MSLPRGIWDRHIALLAGLSDVRRPVVQARVVDLSRYSAVGASWVGCRFGGDADGELFWAAYRDGPAPPLGSSLAIKRGDAPLDARWYAWPLPYAVAGWSMVSTPGVGSAHYAGAVPRDSAGRFYQDINYVEAGINFSDGTPRWAAPEAAPTASPIAGAEMVRVGRGDTGSLNAYRHIFTPPAGATTALMTIHGEDTQPGELIAVWLNDNFVAVVGQTGSRDVVAALLPGQPNILALEMTGRLVEGVGNVLTMAAWKIAGEVA